MQVPPVEAFRLSTRLRSHRAILLGIAFAGACCVAGGDAQAQETAALPALDSLLTAAMAERHLPGLAVAVVRDGKVVVAKGYGVADLARGTPATAVTRFQIASITKSFTALATMQLVEAGRVRLEAPVGTYLPDLPAAWRGVTVRQLLEHTSGIPSISAFERPPCPVAKAPADYVLGDVLAEVACLPLEFTPGDRWAYGDTNYYLLGLLIARVSGVSYEAFLTRGILAPLGMTATRLTRREAEPDLATGYRREAGRYVPVPPMDPLVDEANGALVSTVLDLARWDAALHDERLLPRPALERMWTPAQTRAGPAPYGLGFGLTPFRGRRRVGHTGGGPGCSTAISRFLDEKLTVILLANGEQGAGGMMGLANEVAGLFLGQ